jgi:hypothetical protein
MITTTTKNEIFNKLQFYYSHTKFSINGLQYTTFKHDYNNESEFEKALYKVNTDIFFRDLIARRVEIINKIRVPIIKDIPEIIKTEYRLFSRNKTKTENENWLNHTYNFIININDLSRFIGKSDTVAFLDWYDTMIMSNATVNEKGFDFKNIFNNAKPETIYKYFFDKLVTKGYLSKEDLESYLISAFQEKTLTSKKILFSNKHIGNITSIFYKFYESSENTHGKQKEYAELLGAYFLGFDTQKVMNNFAKSK